jgi:lactate permease
MSGPKRALEVLPAIVACGVSFAGMQFYVSNYWGPELTDIASSLTCIGVMVLVLKIWQPKRILRLESDSPVTVAPRAHSVAELLSAWLPYMMLVVCVLVFGAPWIKAEMNRWTDSLWPAFLPKSSTVLNGLLVPGLHNAITRIPPVTAKPAPYAAVYELNWLSAAGTACLVASILTALILRVSPRRFATVYKATFAQLALPMVTISCMLAVAQLMNYSGMTSTLGLALAATGTAFPFFSATLGWLGVFLTGSDTSANALFGNLQVVTANALSINPVLTASVNSAAGVVGKMISLQSIAVAVAATGMTSADESRLFRFTIKHSILLMMAMGLIAMLYAYVIPGYVPPHP